MMPHNFSRVCSTCEELFVPTGKYQKLCDLCRINHKIKALKKRELNYAKGNKGPLYLRNLNKQEEKL